MPNLKTKVIHIALFLALSLVAVVGAKAQQAPIFTNYSNSYAYANAGFAGMSEGINVLGLYRMQWAGFTDMDGNEVAPTTFLLTGDMPFRRLHGGLEFSIMQDKLGFENNVNIGLGYSYHVDLGGSTLGIGLSVWREPCLTALSTSGSCILVWKATPSFKAWERKATCFSTSTWVCFGRFPSRSISVFRWSTSSKA